MQQMQTRQQQHPFVRSPAVPVPQQFNTQTVSRFDPCQDESAVAMSRGPFHHMVRDRMSLQTDDVASATFAADQSINLPAHPVIKPSLIGMDTESKRPAICDFEEKMQTTGTCPSEHPCK